MATPDDALTDLARALRDDDTMLSERLREPVGSAGLGLLAAAGPRAGGAEADYAFVVEAVREGYLLHYGEARLFAGVDPDLALLGGDHLYALGLERLAGLGDLEAVGELADLISLCARIHADGPAHRATAGALWLAAATAVGSGPGSGHAEAKAALRELGAGVMVASGLASAAHEAAAAVGIEAELRQAADSIDFDLPDSPARG